MENRFLKYSTAVIIPDRVSAGFYLRGIVLTV